MTEERTHLGHAGLRYNANKAPMDLIPVSTLTEEAAVLQKGMIKYAKRNWERGMSHMEVYGCAMRHLLAWHRGENLDLESGESHLAHALTNISFLIEFQKTYPQGDDRPCFMPRIRRLGLDIDEVLADWVGAWMERHGLTERPKFWNFNQDMARLLAEVKDDKDFWMNIKPCASPDDLPFEPVLYLTSRVIPSEWTIEWLEKHRFPVAPVVTLEPGVDKAQTLIDHKVDLYVDDRIDNFIAINQAGINCLLMTAEHNLRYSVGSRRISSLKEIR